MLAADDWTALEIAVELSRYPVASVSVALVEVISVKLAADEETLTSTIKSAASRSSSLSEGDELVCSAEVAEEEEVDNAGLPSDEHSSTGDKPEYRGEGKSKSMRSPWASVWGWWGGGDGVWW